MKTRLGFVSNSSSSSFVIEKTSYTDNPAKEIVSKEQIEMLIKEGFKECEFFLKLEITCNQDDVIYLLVKNKIPFRASLHYGHESVIYLPESDDLFYGVNFGAIMETYGEQMVNLNSKEPPYKAVKGKDFLAQEEKFWHNI